MSCSAKPLRSSGRSARWFKASSSPSTRSVGGRPTLRCRSDALRRIISCSTSLKLSGAAGSEPTGVGAGGAIVPARGVGLAIGIDPEEDLAVLDGLGILDEDLANDAGVFGFNLVHDFHSLDDTEALPLR